MFRLGKRNFSLRDSPNSKLTSSSPLPLLHSSSPAKRLRFGDASPLLSSTLLNETKILEESKADTNQDFDKSLIQEKSFLEKDPRSFVERECRIFAERDFRTSVDQETRTQENRILADRETRSKVAVETPPPTPEVKIISKLDTLNKQKTILIEEGEKLNSQIEAQIKSIDDCRGEIDVMRASRYKYEDFVTMVTRGQNEIRDHLNQIFTPGNELAEKFEPIMREIWDKQSRKLEKKCLEWNCQIDQARSVIAKRIEDLNHEMELHQRTLLHQEHLSRAQEEALESKLVDKDEKVDESKNSSDSVDVCDVQDSDVILLDHSDDAHIVHEEIVTEQSVDGTDIKVENDDDDTDVEEINSEEPRSFTPCQAQRPE